MSKFMTLKEISEATGVAYSTIASYAQDAGWTENGKRTLLNEQQATLILEAMKQPVSSGRKSNLLVQLEGVNTEQSTALRVDLLHREIEALLKADIERLKGDVASLKEDNALLVENYETEIQREQDDWVSFARDLSEQLEEQIQKASK